MLPSGGGVIFPGTPVPPFIVVSEAAIVVVIVVANAVDPDTDPDAPGCGVIPVIISAPMRHCVLALIGALIS